jgi:GntR family transcriptional regulator, transcriptional repressor for pyruvate dehydrogenase complex
MVKASAVSFHPKLPSHERRLTVTHQVVDAICRMLRSGHYQVGDRLPSEQELCVELQVSRSAVREAVRELTTIDVLEIRPGRGTFVRSLRADLLFRPDSLGESLNDLVRTELLEVRRIIEPEAAALATLRATPEEVRRLEQDVDALDLAIGQGFRPPEDLGFHLDIIRSTHNSSLVRMSGVIISFYGRDGQLPTKRDAIEHWEIFEAIQNGDPDRARLLMQQHLDAQG